jgi:hypothetical protein
MAVPFVAYFTWLTWRVLYKKDRKSGLDAKIPLSHLSRVTTHPAYQAVFRKYRYLKLASLISLAIMIIMLAITTMRPVSVSIIEPELHNRDIVLCLDVSGSMSEVDAKLLGIFRELSGKFKGERIGLTIFDSSPVTVFPLTDDYEFIAEQLKIQEESFAKNDYTAQEGTFEGEGSSLIGDGLASCVMRFDSLNTKRSRSIIFATDNFVNGSPIITLEQAGTLARDKQIRVYGINPSDVKGSSYISDQAKEYKNVVLSTQGSYYPIGDRSSIDVDVAQLENIVLQITQQDATRFKGSPRRVEQDVPTTFIILAFIGAVCYVGMMWRLQE